MIAAYQIDANSDERLFEKFKAYAKCLIFKTKLFLAQMLFRT